jgi:hypothetical protein
MWARLPDQAAVMAAEIRRSCTKLRFCQEQLGADRRRHAPWCPSVAGDGRSGGSELGSRGEVGNGLWTAFPIHR